MDIFVGSLPFKIKEEEVRALFEKFGEVASVKIIIDKITRQNKGFGFVEMSNDAEGDRAIKALSGYELDGRNLTVNEARPKGEGGGGNRGGRGGGGGQRQNNRW